MNPVRNSIGALNPAPRGGTPYAAEPGIILKSNPAEAAGPEGTTRHYCLTRGGKPSPLADFSRYRIHQLVDGGSSILTG